MKAIAENHPQILHSDADGQWAFVVDDLIDLLEGVFKTKLKSSGVSLRLADAIIKPSSGEAKGLLAAFETGFAVLERCQQKTFGAINDAQNNCYQIAKEIIALLIQDSREGNTLFQYSLNQMEDGHFVKEKLTFEGDGTWAGYLVTLNFKVEYIEDIEELVNNTGWLNR